MTNNELNNYIKHYIEKDKTGRAIMLTGDWGIGKSYYIKNSLIPFLAKEENGKHPCIVVSLYGLSSLTEISKAIYLEARVKKLNPESEAGKIALFAGKTVIKGVASFFGVDLSANADDFQSIYESIDLSGKLLILEDVERTKISILELLGYVNSLVEQDGVKVLLVTNEEEIIKYEPNKAPDPESEKSISMVEKKIIKEKKYTDDTIRYLEVKEKTVGDTITYVGDLHSAIKEIIDSFEHAILQKYNTDQCADDIMQIMFFMSSSNLRSVIFACQKTADIFDTISDIDSYSDDFLKTIFYGILFFSFRLHSGNRVRWIGLTHFSQELGSEHFPLFRFCFDYIIEQHIISDEIPQADEALKSLRLYDINKTSDDPDFLMLVYFYLYTETEVINAVDRIAKRLRNPDDISFFDYGKIAVSIVTLKYYLGIDIDEIKELLIENLKGRSNMISEDRIFRQMLGDLPEKETEEFNQLRTNMCKSLYSVESFLNNFDYSPENAKKLGDLIEKNKELIYNTHGFVKHIDVDRFVKMFAQCSPAQMDDIRSAFHKLYQSANIADFLSEDEEPIQHLLNCLQDNSEQFQSDRIKTIQFNWFVNKLKGIEKKYNY